MKVHSTPPPLRLAILALLSWIPLAWMEKTVLLPRTESWVKPAVTASVAVLLALRLWRLGRETPKAVLFATGAWALVSLGQAVWLRSFWLAIFSVVVVFMGFFLSQWIASSLARPWSEAGLRWFVGFPDALPGLTARIQGTPEELRVAAIDREGAFLFHPGTPLRVRPSPFPIEFRDRAGRSFLCLAAPTVTFRGGCAAGVRFRAMDLLNSKRSGDMIEALKGVGYEA